LRSRRKKLFRTRQNLTVDGDFARLKSAIFIVEGDDWEPSPDPFTPKHLARPIKALMRVAIHEILDVVFAEPDTWIYQEFAVCGFVAKVAMTRVQLSLASALSGKGLRDKPEAMSIFVNDDLAQGLIVFNAPRR
jgi:hypothetical protein